MCGISAAFAYAANGYVDVARLERARDRMACRGPDDAGTWISNDGRIALAHRRLSIIDLSERGSQPMRSADGRLVISFNGEIYNYRELRSQLELKGRKFRSRTDTEVLLELYAECGEAMLPKLRGMFAFALWDESKRALLLARDTFGIKPLYYANDGRCLRVASEVKALIAGGGIDTSAEPAGHVGFFLWGHVPEPYTLYRGIRAVPAGCSIWVTSEGVLPPTTFFSPDHMLAADAAPKHAATVVQAPERLRSALLDTVRHHLLADVDVGVFLSAGLDSISLAALAAHCGSRLRTVTLGFAEYRGTPQDETVIAEDVARSLGAQHTTVWISRNDFQRELPRILDRMDQPSADGVNTYFVARAAAEVGLKVALSGLGGDELFAGYPSFRQIPRLVRLLGRVPGLPFIGRGFRIASAGAMKRLTSPKYAGVIEYGCDYGSAYLLRRGMFMPWELPELLDPETARQGWRDLRTHLLLAQTAHDRLPDRLKITALETVWYMRHQLLRDADWASMSHSLEVRVPMVDTTFWREAVSLIRQNPNITKSDVAFAAWPGIPRNITSRAKTGFVVPVRTWMTQQSGVAGASRGLRGWARFVHARYGQS